MNNGGWRAADSWTYKGFPQTRVTSNERACFRAKWKLIYLSSFKYFGKLREKNVYEQLTVGCSLLSVF